MNPTDERRLMQTGRSQAGLAILLMVLLAAVAACGGQTPSQKALDELNAGLAADAAGNVDEAVTHYKACLTAEPSNKFCIFNIGVADQRAGRAVEAENNYRLALAQDPDFGSALYNLAILRKEAGALDETISLYRHLLQVDPGNASGHFNLGIALAESGDSKGAKEELDQAVKLNPALVVPSPLPGPSTPSSSQEQSPRPS